VKKILTILFTISVFLVGAALIPFVGLPQEGFSWQRFADVYNPMSLVINYETGSPGSFFTINGSNFPEEEMVTIFANGVDLGMVETDSDGNLFFLINSGAADPGLYIVTTGVPGGSQALFQLDPAAPLRAQDGTGPILLLQADVPSLSIHLPVMHKD
jgi:hypothetical protein